MAALDPKCRKSLGDSNAPLADVGQRQDGFGDVAHCVYSNVRDMCGF